MGKDKNDEAYEHGVHDGKEGGALDDFVHGLVRNTPLQSTREEIYNKGYDYGREHRYDGSGDSSSSDDSGSGSSLCFLTSACTEAMGLPDSCYELGTLRQFRDEYLASSPEGRQAIREYYETAPMVVTAIKLRDDHAVVLQEIYSQLVEPAVRLIEAKEHTRAFQLYRAVFLRLRDEFVPGVSTPAMNAG